MYCICARRRVLGHRTCPNAKTSLSLSPARQLLPRIAPRNARDARKTSAPANAMAGAPPNGTCPCELDETHHRRSLRPLPRSPPLARLGNAWVLASRLGQHRSTPFRPCFQPGDLRCTREPRARSPSSLSCCSAPHHRGTRVITTCIRCITPQQPVDRDESKRALWKRMNWYSTIGCGLMRRDATRAQLR